MITRRVSKDTYKCISNLLRISNHGSAAIEDAHDHAMVWRILDNVFADHVHHLLMPFHDGYVVFEEFRPRDMSCGGRSTTCPSLRPAMVLSTFGLRSCICVAFALMLLSDLVDVVLNLLVLVDLVLLPHGGGGWL